MKKISVVLCALFAPVVAFASDVDLEGKELILNIRRIGLDISKTSVRHSDEYATSPISALSADDQEFIKGVFDTALEYTHGRFNWDNSLFMEYGRTEVKPYNEPKTVNESADKILLSSNLNYACWDYDTFKLGPMARAAYETEFVPANDSDHRLKVLRGMAGFAIFDSPIIKDLHIAGVYEYDFTYGHDQVSKLAAEVGWRLEYDVREGVKLSTDGYYREYLDYSQYVGTDLERDLSVTARMDTNLWGDFALGPYVQYRRAKARDAENYGSNFIIGLSFNYITKFGIY
ncbi:MAG: DUF3078 domain-containing protein [Alphaproteobacteria bacterium]|nr:DUF3078 domain-containing protein [Alphaproteobacteria bacterium]